MYVSEKQERRWLIGAIRGLLLPEFARRGFEARPLPLGQDGPPDRRLVVSHPFGRLRRPAKNGIEFVEIELAPRGRAAFRIASAVAPSEGVEGVLGHIAAEDVLVTWLNEVFYLYRSPRLRGWFAMRRWPWSGERGTKGDYHMLVGEAVELVPEIEQALSEGNVGPHTRRVVLRRPTVSKR